MRYVQAFSCFCVLMLLTGGLVVAQDQLQLFVAPNGNNAWSGGLAQPNEEGTDGPLSTLEAARDKLRSLKGSGYLKAGATVSVREGTYYLSKTLDLGPRDSGTRDHPIVYRAYQDENPILVGGRPITGWTQHKGKILKADVGAQGFKGVYFRQLFFNGKRQHLARYPDFDPARPYTGGWLYVGGKASSIYEQSADKTKRSLAFKEGDVRDYATPYEGEVDVYAYQNWSNCVVRVLSIDRDKGVMTLAKDAHRGIRLGNRYRLRNFFEDLDAEGEWYLDRKTWTLYFWPPSSIDNGVVTAPLLETIVQIGNTGRGTSHVVFRGFTIECCDGTGISVRDSIGCLVAGNTVRNVTGRLSWSAAGISVRGGSGNGVVGNDVYDTGSHGIVIYGGDIKALTSAGNYADNNYVHHVGFLDGHAMGLIVREVGNRLSHNLIHDCARCGIMASGKLHTIEYNRIRHCNLKTCDTGGIYIHGASTGWVPSGVQVRHNFITDILGYGPVKGKWVSPHYSWGIYLDDGFSGAHVYGNVVARTPYDGIFIHGGRENVIENNVIINCTRGQMIYSSWTPEPQLKERIIKWFRTCQDLPAYRKRFPGFSDLPISVIPKMSDNKFLRNIVYYTDPDSSLYRLRNLVLEKTESDSNLIYHFGHTLRVDLKGVRRGSQWQEWKKLGFEKRSVIADPLFANPKKDDYRLHHRSPARQLGFKEIPFDKIGPYEHELRASWPIVEAEGVREKPLLGAWEYSVPKPKRKPKEKARKPDKAAEKKKQEKELLALGRSAAPELRKWVIEGVASGRKLSVYVTIRGANTRARIIAADDVGISVMEPRGKTQVPWDDVSASQLYNMAKKYAGPKGRPVPSERKRLLEAFFLAHGLDD